MENNIFYWRARKHSTITVSRSWIRIKEINIFQGFNICQDRTKTLQKYVNLVLPRRICIYIYSNILTCITLLSCPLYSVSSQYSNLSILFKIRDLHVYTCTHQDLELRRPKHIICSFQSTGIIITKHKQQIIKQKRIKNLIYYCTQNHESEDNLLGIPRIVAFISDFICLHWRVEKENVIERPASAQGDKMIAMGDGQPETKLSSTYPLAPMDYVNLYTNDNIKTGKAPLPPPIIKVRYKNNKISKKC